VNNSVKLVLVIQPTRLPQPSLHTYNFTDSFYAEMFDVKASE